jgi:hypothetical protein
LLLGVGVGALGAVDVTYVSMEESLVVAGVDDEVEVEVEVVG